MTTQQDPQDHTPQDEEIVTEEDTSISQDDSSGVQTQSTEIDEIARLQAALARAQADYQNLLMRGERDKADMVHFLSAKMLLPLLTQVDHLERAIKLKEGVEGDAFVDGIRSLYAGIQKYLESQGVTSFESVGKEVDHDRHDVMTQGPGKEGEIVSEFEKGYMIGARVLRHAKVVVGSGEMAEV